MAKSISKSKPNTNTKKLRGGSILESVGGFVYFWTLFIAVAMMVMVTFIFLGLLVCIYFIMNGVLAGTNLVIDVTNMSIMPIVLAIIDVINGIIRAINGLSGG
jgi:hypothetical protein